MHEAEVSESQESRMAKTQNENGCGLSAHPEVEPEAMGRIASGILDSIPQEKPPESGKKPYSSSASESTGQISRVKRKDGRISDCKDGCVKSEHPKDPDLLSLIAKVDPLEGCIES